jgi:hypothetical protein
MFLTFFRKSFALTPSPHFMPKHFADVCCSDCDAMVSSSSRGPMVVYLLKHLIHFVIDAKNCC